MRLRAGFRTQKCKKNSSPAVTDEGLAAVYGWAEVADAQADVAREDYDI